MKLYDECLVGVEELLADTPVEKLSPETAPAWPDAGNNQVLFQQDTAYELGANGHPAISSVALTDQEAFVPGDEVWLLGKDLSELTGNGPYARVAFVRVNEEAMGTGEKLYQTIRKIEYSRYHLSPEGFMMRISTFAHREGVRVSKEAVRKGLSFATVGKMFIDTYKKQPQVEAVKLYFITDPGFPYDKLETIMKKSEDITTALDHLMRDVKMDCASCSLQDVCDEVEELYKKDFQKEMK